MSEKSPVYGMPENVSRTLGRDAQRNNILAARVVADIVKTTLGPKGMDKMLVDAAGNIIITNDGVTILEEIEIDHPAAKLIVEVAKTQESEVGDGTTTAALLAGALLEKAENLLDRRIHPTLIVRGYRMAADKAYEFLSNNSLSAENKEVLKRIAMTAMTGKGAEGNREKFAELIVNAIDKVAHGSSFSQEDVKIVKIKGDRSGHSELIEGVVIDKEVAHADMPRTRKDAQIALVDVSLEIRNPETETKVSVTSPEQFQAFLDSEELSLKEMARQLAESGANVIFCQKGIDDVIQYYLSKAGIMALRRVPRSDMEKLASATSAKIISNLNELSNNALGYAKSVDERMQGGNKMTYITGCREPRAVTLLVYGSTPHSLDESERALRDGIGVVSAVIKDGRLVTGGGAIEIEVARQMRAYAHTLGGKEQLAVEAFASALEVVPEALAENAGLDPVEIIAELRRRHEIGQVRDGINLLNDKIEDCFHAGIVEPLKVKTQAISSATEVAMMILRIDDVLISSDKLPTNTRAQDVIE